MQEGGEEAQEGPKTEVRMRTTKMAGVAAQILHLDLSEILERPADTWAAVVNQAFRSCARMFHSTNKSDREVFADCKQAQQTLRQWLQLCEVKCKILQELFQEFSGCWCSKCHNLFARMSCVKPRRWTQALGSFSTPSGTRQGLCHREAGDCGLILLRGSRRRSLRNKAGGDVGA